MTNKLIGGMVTMWSEHFEQVLNVEDVWEANINVVSDSRKPVLGELNKRAISIELVWDAVNKMKYGKVSGLDGFPVESVMKCGMTVLEWLVKLINSCFYMWAVPTWTVVVHVHSKYIGKGDN